MTRAADSSWPQRAGACRDVRLNSRQPSQIEVLLRRIVSAVVLAVSILLAPLAAEAQSAQKIWRIGWLSHASSATGASEFEALRKGLAEFGYVEGRNIAIEARWAQGEPPRLLRLRRARRAQGRCHLYRGTPASLAAKQATATIPVVFSRTAFPERTGLVSSLARSGAI